MYLERFKAVSVSYQNFQSSLKENFGMCQMIHRSKRNKLKITSVLPFRDNLEQFGIHFCGIFILLEEVLRLDS